MFEKKAQQKLTIEPFSPLQSSCLLYFSSSSETNERVQFSSACIQLLELNPLSNQQPRRGPNALNVIARKTKDRSSGQPTHCTDWLPECLRPLMWAGFQRNLLLQLTLSVVSGRSWGIPPRRRRIAEFRS